MGAGDLVDRQELAGDLRDRVAPGQTIVWSSASATIKLWQSGLLWTITLVLAVLGLALWLRPFGVFDWPYRSLWLIGVLTILSACTLILALKAGPAIVLTESEVYTRRCFPGDKIQRFARSDIAEATVFAGDGTVLLHAANGNQSRLNGGSKARDFAEALAIPARIWAAHEGPSVGGIVSLILIGVAGGILHSLYGFVIGWLAGDERYWRPHAVLALVGAAAVLYLLGHAYKAWRMDPDERRRAACMLLDPRWRGRDPYSSGSIPLWQIPMATITLWVVKAIYRMPTECMTGHEPEIIDPGHAAAAE